MPELPEVETIRNHLSSNLPGSPSILGRKILRGRVFWDRTLATPSVEAFDDRIQGQVIQEIGRRGKFLIFKLSEDYLLFHLRMSGDMWVRPVSEPLAAHDRLVLDLEGGWALAFNDTRKFGRAWLVNDPQTVLHSLGPEPLSPSFTPQELYDRLHARHRQLKPLLLDQTFLAGMGNIYVDEALNLAHLHPLQLSDSLSEAQSERLYHSIRTVLREGIRRHGASIDWVYRGGDFQNYFRVYSRKGEPCPECGTPIVRIVVGQRGTYYCPVCQPPPENRG